MRVALTAACALLAGCSDAPADGDTAPVMTVAPQAITYPDIETNNLYGSSCAYASGKSMAPVVIGFDDQAVMKIDGKIARFTLDPQSKGTRFGTGSRYLADGRVLDLAIEGEGNQTGYETVHYEGSVRLSTADGLQLYATAGTVQCGN